MTRHLPAWDSLRAVVIDYGGTLSSAPYFRDAPPGCPDWLHACEEVVFREDSPLFDEWMAGAVSARDVAAVLAPHVSMSLEATEAHMRRGCRGLPLNAEVVRFTRAQRRAGRKAALVTCNVDLFLEEVVPNQGLDRLFDVVVSSHAFKDTRKDNLWPRAFELLDRIESASGARCHGYATSFALDDSRAMVDLFISHGGRAFQYTSDEAFARWLAQG